MRAGTDPEHHGLCNERMRQFAAFSKAVATSRAPATAVVNHHGEGTLWVGGDGTAWAGFEGFVDLRAGAARSGMELSAGDRARTV